MNAKEFLNVLVVHEKEFVYFHYNIYETIHVLICNFETGEKTYGEN